MEQDWFCVVKRGDVQIYRINKKPRGTNSKADDMIIVLAMLPDFFEIRETTWALRMARPMIAAA